MKHVHADQVGDVMVATLLVDWLGSDEEDSPESHQTLQELWGDLAEVAAQASGIILLDFDHIKGMNAEGSSFLFRFRQTISAAGREMALCGVSAEIREILELLRWGSLFRCYPSRSVALEVLERNK